MCEGWATYVIKVSLILVQCLQLLYLSMTCETTLEIISIKHKLEAVSLVEKGAILQSVAEDYIVYNVLFDQFKISNYGLTQERIIQNNNPTISARRSFTMFYILIQLFLNHSQFQKYVNQNVQ